MKYFILVVLGLIFFYVGGRGCFLMDEFGIVGGIFGFAAWVVVLVVYLGVEAENKKREEISRAARKIAGENGER